MSFSSPPGKDSDSVEPPSPAAEDNKSQQLRYVSGQYFFEYLVVVSLQKAKGSSSYEPQITYQFPKVGQWDKVLSNYQGTSGTLTLKLVVVGTHGSEPWSTMK